MDSIFFKKHAEKYVYIFTDCELIKGFTRTSLIDISRKQIFFIPNSYYELSLYFRKKNIGEILKILEDQNSHIQFYKFLDFLLEEHIATLIDDITLFPEINVCWDHASSVTNAIIDVRKNYNYLPKAINELSQLRCEYLQIRFYEETGSETIKCIAGLIKGKCFKDVQVLLKYNEAILDSPFLQGLTAHQRNLHFIIHSAPAVPGLTKQNNIRYTKQIISSCSNCGLIDQYSLHIPSLQGFMENKLFNSCLNRKIAVDEQGNIGNCPSIKKKYGNIMEQSLLKVAKRNDFKKIWNLNKDTIDTCRDCEFRYICSDCRAYTTHGIKSKPAKCGYDPYTGSWERLGV